MPKSKFKSVEEQTAVKTRKVTYHVFEMDSDGRLREPRQRGYGCCVEHLFDQYGYDTPQEAEQAIEDKTHGYGGYFVIAKVNINTEYV